MTLTTAVLAMAVLAGGKAQPSLEAYKFGMTKEQVQAIPGCGEYKPVPSTGGLECPAFPWAGKKRNLSFIFHPGEGLVKLQLWVYEGQNEKDARTATDEMLKEMAKRYGPLESSTLGPKEKVTTKALFDALAKSVGNPRKAQLKPAKDPKAAFTFASVIHAEAGYYVFLYRQPPRG